MDYGAMMKLMRPAGFLAGRHVMPVGAPNTEFQPRHQTDDTGQDAAQK